jgi:hypothetical protein
LIRTARTVPISVYGMLISRRISVRCHTFSARGALDGVRLPASIFSMAIEATTVVSTKARGT